MSVSTFKAPSYLLHKARNKGRSRVNGKDIYFPGKYDSKESRTAYRELVAKLASEHRQKLRRSRGEEILKGECLVCELIVDYLRHADEYYALSDQPQHIRLAIRPLRDLYSRLGVDEITPKKWKAIREWMVANGQTRSGINYSMARLLRMFKWGVEEEIISNSTYQALKCVSPLKKGRCGNVPEAPKREAVSDDQVEAIKDFVLPEVWAMVQVQRLSGMRPGEVCELKGNNITRETDVWVYRPDKHKNTWRQKERVVYLGPQCQKVLLPYLRADPSRHLFSPKLAMVAKWERNREAAKDKLYGKRKERIESKGLGGDLLDKLANSYTPKTYRDAIKRACKRAKIEKWTPYQLRHAAAQATREAHGIEGVSAVLGNTIDAAQIYAERNLKLARELAKKCG